MCYERIWQIKCGGQIQQVRGLSDLYVDEQNNRFTNKDGRKLLNLQLHVEMDLVWEMKGIVAFVSRRSR